MGVIQKRVKFAGSKGKEEVEATFDTGSTYSCIQPGLAGRLGHIEPLPEPIVLSTAKEEEKLTANERIVLDFHFNGLRFSDEFMLIPKLSEPALLGASTMQKWRMKLDLEKEEVIVDPRVTRLRLLHI